MFRINLFTTLLCGAAVLAPLRANAAPPLPAATYRLQVNLETGATTQTAPLPASGPQGARLKKVVLDRAETAGAAPPRNPVAPLKGTKAVRRGAPVSPADLQPSLRPAAVEPFIYVAALRNSRNTFDDDNDGFYSAFEFDIGVFADISEGSMPVSATVSCVTTGQQWSIGSWTVTYGQPRWMEVTLNEKDFQGRLTGNTYLDFTVTISWNINQEVHTDTETTVVGEPFPVDPIQQPYISQAAILSLRNTTDEDFDGYYSRFAFDLGVDADYPSGSATVATSITCQTTKQSWQSEPFGIQGTQPVFARIPLSEKDFAAKISANTSLDFTVGLYDSTFTTRYDRKTQVTGEPLNADPTPPYLASVRIHNLSNLLDADRDGYYARFAFDVGIDADVPRIPALAAARITCTTTGQSWDTAPWNVTGVGQDFANVRLDQSDFAGHLSGNTKLDFTVQLYDGTLKTLLDATTQVENEPFLADTGIPSIASAKIYNLTNLRDDDGDGFYSQYDFDLGINAVMDVGSFTVRGRILCPTTGQTWDVAPWTVSAGVKSWKNVPFNEARFAGYLSRKTELSFTVEIYDADWSNLLDSTSSVSGQPFPAVQIRAPDAAVDLVRHFYNAVLARDPELGALDAWINGYFLYSLYSDIDVRFIGREMGRIFFFSPEYAGRNRDNAEFITDCYQAFLWRDPSDAELAAWLGGVWNRAQAMTIFAESEEFGDLMSVQWFPGYAGKPVRNFATTMYIGFLDRLPDQGGLDYWSATLEQAADKRQASKEMALAILHSAEYLGKSDPASTTVIRLYRSFMGRFPSDGEAAYWADEIASGRQTLEQAVEVFGNSEEFTIRLGQYF